MAAAAAGVMRRDRTSSAPTTCTACAAASPTSTAKTMLMARTGTPRASATSGSADENTSGRYSTISAPQMMAATTAICTRPCSDTPTICPVSREKLVPERPG